MKEELTAEKELKPQGDLVFALDIGTRTVVGMIGRYIDEKFCLEDYVSVPHTKRAMVDGQVEDIKQVAKIVAQAKNTLEQRNGVKLTHVSIAAAGRALKTIQASLDFDVTDRENLTDDDVKSMEIETIQKAQAELDSTSNGKTLFYCVGHSIISYKLDDYKIISLVGHKGDKAEVELVAAFLPSIVIEGLYAVMDLNGLEVNSLTLEPIAAMNVIVPPEIRLINIALVDIGAGTSDIAIAKNGSVCAYAMATTAGDEITEEIIRTCLVDFSTAEMLKQSCSNGEENIEYKDILGIPHKTSAAEVAKLLNPAVDTLSDTICEQIIEANGDSPAAVFLVGGGSLIEGLPATIAKKLELDESRVAIGGGDFLKNVDSTAAKLGAEFVTPLGIAVTAMLDQGYDFSVVTVNDRKVRVFDTKQLSVFEALTMAGYKSAEIMGRSGRGLSFTLNGSHQMIKGGAMTPAEVYVNDRPSSIMTKVTQGDRIRIVPAISGENASVKLSDVLTYGRFKTGRVTFGGEQHEIGLKAFVNGEEKPSDYKIQPLDSIETEGVVTFGDLLTNLDIGFTGFEYRIGESVIEESYELCDGDVILAYDSYGNIVGGQLQTNSASSEEAEEVAEETAEEATETAEVAAAPDEVKIAAEENISAGEETAAKVIPAPIAPVSPQDADSLIRAAAAMYEQTTFIDQTLSNSDETQQTPAPAYAEQQPAPAPAPAPAPVYDNPYGTPNDRPFSSFTYTQEQIEAMVRADGGAAAHAAIARELGIEQFVTPPERFSQPAPAPVPNAIPFDRRGITVKLNGETIELPQRSGGYLLLDLVAKVDIDPSVPNSEIILQVNGQPASFSTEISDGDDAVIRVQERQVAR